MPDTPRERLKRPLDDKENAGTLSTLLLASGEEDLSRVAQSLHAHAPLDVDVYFQALLDSLGIPAHDLTRSSLSADEKWTLLRSYNQVTCPPSSTLPPATLPTAHRKATKELLKSILPKKKGKRMDARVTRVLQQMSPLQFVQCLHVVLDGSHDTAPLTPVQARRKKGSRVRSASTAGKSSDVMGEQLLALLQGLRINLSAQPIAWLLQFVEEAGGLKYVIVTLSYLQSRAMQAHPLLAQIQYEAVKCLNYTLNHQRGLETLVAEQRQCRAAIEQLVSGLYASLSATKAVCGKLLAVFAVVDDCRGLVMDALGKAARLRQESSRFCRLVLCLNEDSALEVKINCLVLMNALLYHVMSPATQTLLVEEFDRLGLGATLCTLEKAHACDSTQGRLLHTQITKFRDILTSGYLESDIDTTDLSDALPDASHQQSAVFLRKKLAQEKREKEGWAQEAASLEASFYALVEENQSLREWKEQSTEELHALCTQIATLEATLEDMERFQATAQPAPSLPRGHEGLARKSDLQSYSDLFAQFEQELQCSPEQIESELQPIESFFKDYSQLETVNEFLEEKQLALAAELAAAQEALQDGDLLREQALREKETAQHALHLAQQAHVEQVAQLEGEVTRLGEDKITLRYRLSQVQEAYDALQATCETQEHSVQNCTQQSQHLERRLAHAQEQLDTAHSHTTHLQQQLDQLTREHAAQAQTLLQLETRRADAARAAHTREEQLCEQVQRLEETIHSQSSQAHAQDTALLHEQSARREVEETLRQACEYRSELHERLHQAEAEQERLHAQLAHQQGEQASLQEQWTRALQEEKEPLEADYARLLARFSAMEKNLATREEQLTFLQHTLACERQHTHTLTAQHTHSHEELVHLQEQHTALQRQYTAAQEAHAALHTQWSEATALVRAHAREKEELSVLRHEFDVQLSALQKEFAHVMAERDRLESQNQTVQAHLRIVMGELDALGLSKEQVEAARDQVERERQLLAQETRQARHAVESEREDLDERERAHALKLANLERAKKQFHQEISSFLANKQKHEAHAEQCRHALREQAKEIERSKLVLAQEKEAFACYQGAEKKSLTDQKAVLAQLEASLAEKHRLMDAKSVAPRPSPVASPRETTKPKDSEKTISPRGEISAPPPPPPPGAMGGAIPPPPPPPGLTLGEEMGDPEGCEIHPSVKLKCLNWKKISPQSYAHSLWKTVTLPSSVPLPTHQLEALFPATTPSAMKKKSSSRNHTSPTLVDARRAQNVAIFLSSSKCSGAALAHAIHAMDAPGLSDSQLSQLLAHVPTPDELDALQSHQQENPEGALGPVESFFVQVGAIPHYMERVSLLHIMRVFPDRYNDLRGQLDHMRALLSCVEEAEAFPALLKIILHFGNFINHGSSRGRAWGFKLSSLECLMNMRANGNEGESKSVRTLLHVLVEFMQEHYADLESAFVYQLDPIIQLDRPAFHEAPQELAQLTARIQHAQDLSASLGEEATPSTMNTVTRFLEQAQEQLHTLTQGLEQAQSQLSTLAQFYGYSVTESRSLTVDEFLLSIGQFGRHYMATKKAMLAQQQRQVEAARRETAAKERKEALAKKKQARQSMKVAEEKMVDNVFDTLCHGNFSKRRSRLWSRKNRIQEATPSREVKSPRMQQNIEALWEALEESSPSLAHSTATSSSSSSRRFTPVVV